MIVIKRMCGNINYQRLSGVSMILQRNLTQPVSSVNDEDVGRHSKLADQWWNENGPMKGLHSMNKCRVPFIRDGLLTRTSHESSKPLKDLSILDVGCGGGILSEPLARIGADVTGIDPSPELIEIAKNHAKTEPNLIVQYCNTTIESFRAANDSITFDGVVLSEIIEHVADKDKFIEDAVSFLPENGSMFISTMNKTYVSYLLSIVAAEYLLNIVPKDTHDWNLFVDPVELQRILEKHGCHVVKIHGMFYNPLSNVWCWTAFMENSYILQAVKK